MRTSARSPWLSSCSCSILASVRRSRDEGPPPDGRKDVSKSGSDAPRDADVHAFLIADVRGYTTFTQERGDEQAARLAARFAEVSRQVVEANGGRVLELRGDEALAVFGSPRAAIRAAVGLQQRFVDETVADPTLPLAVGIGIDAGEAVPVEGGFRGAALNVAARLCSRASAGEVLASAEVVHLARLVPGVLFTPRADVAVKGIDKPLRVVAVRAKNLDAVRAIAPFVRLTIPAAGLRKRWLAVPIVAALAIIAAVVAVPRLTEVGRPTSEIEPDSVGVIDPGSGEVSAAFAFESRPGAVAASTDGVWVTHPDIGTVTRLDRNKLGLLRLPWVRDAPS